MRKDSISQDQEQTKKKKIIQDEVDIESLTRNVFHKKCSHKDGLQCLHTVSAEEVRTALSGNENVKIPSFIVILKQKLPKYWH